MVIKWNSVCSLDIHARFQFFIRNQSTKRTQVSYLLELRYFHKSHLCCPVCIQIPVFFMSSYVRVTYWVLVFSVCFGTIINFNLKNDVVFVVTLFKKSITSLLFIHLSVSYFLFMCVFLHLLDRVSTTFHIFPSKHLHVYLFLSVSPTVVLIFVPSLSLSLYWSPSLCTLLPMHTRKLSTNFITVLFPCHPLFL